MKLSFYYFLLFFSVELNSLFLCDLCESILHDNRNHCTNCKDFDVCGECIKAAQEKDHKNHKFVLL